MRLFILLRICEFPTSRKWKLAASDAMPHCVTDIIVIDKTPSPLNDK